MVLGIIQARTNSTRLPGKIHQPILGRPMLALMLERVARARSLDAVVVATTDTPADDATAALAAACGMRVFRGSEHDVLDRYYQAARAAGAQPDTIIVRLTGDCTLHDPAVVDAVVARYRAADDASAYVGTPRNYPEGLDTEAFAYSSLEEAAHSARLPSEREHVGRYFHNHPERFALIEWREGSRDDSAMHWSVDTPTDFAFVSAVYEALYPDNPAFGMHDVLALLAKRPDLLELNRGGTGYEGLAKSLQEDEAFSRGHG